MSQLGDLPIETDESTGSREMEMKHVVMSVPGLRQTCTVWGHGAMALSDF